MDYTVFYKSNFESLESCIFPKYDLFLSGFDDCDRTKAIYDKVDAVKKIWLIFPHYNLLETDYNSYTDTYKSDAYEEDVFYTDLLKNLNISADLKLCIDITGFIRPHLIYLLKLLYIKGITKIDFLYSEPKFYRHAEDTDFTGIAGEVENIKWHSAEYNNPETENDVLIIAAGYDDKLITKVSQAKSRIKNKYHIIGFPSLQPDMYQENILKLHQIKESVGFHVKKMAPAFDPFVTAQMIHEIIKENKKVSNIYLCPLSTKPQALGMALYYLWNYEVVPINILFPYSKIYYSKTAVGIKKIWKYTVELPKKVV